MSLPAVTVCVVTYNQRNFIETCLRSILDQKAGAKLSVLVGDDGSTDGTSEIIEALAAQYGKRLRHFRREPNMGAKQNMCDLLLRAEGEFIARVDGDDYWLPGKLGRQLDYLAKHPACSAVYANAVTVDEAGTRLGLFNDLGDVRITLPALLRRGNALNNSSVLFRATNLPLWANNADQLDYEVHLSQALRGWLGHIGEPLAAYRVATRGSMVASSNERVRELYWQAIQSVPRNAVSDDDYARGLADFLRRVFFRSLATRDPGLLRTWAARVYAASPYGAAWTTVLVAANILRICGKMLAARVSLSGQEKNVLYRH
ncbi:glycosyltransferase [Luteimonas deserti]|uniref:Glycosyltransferase n=1 Tax=Luteimonas deserti TaxID=2752306 RepID=A0A7Z0TYD9_9GAMM|nr:glycosyltransferase [Luteimonas deserti]NYZ62825.1 glycosyltransferase [Luteimonas deserti]